MRWSGFCRIDSDSSRCVCVCVCVFGAVVAVCCIQHGQDFLFFPFVFVLTAPNFSCDN